MPTLAALMGGPEAMMEITPSNRSSRVERCLAELLPVSAGPARRAGARDRRRGDQCAKASTFAKMTGVRRVEASNDPKLANLRMGSSCSGAHARQCDSIQTKLDNADVPAAIDEIPNVSTNTTAQWSLNAIELMELVGKERAPSSTNHRAGQSTRVIYCRILVTHKNRPHLQ